MRPRSTSFGHLRLLDILLYFAGFPPQQLAGFREAGVIWDVEGGWDLGGGFGDRAHSIWERGMGSGRGVHPNSDIMSDSIISDSIPTGMISCMYS